MHAPAAAPLHVPAGQVEQAPFQYVPARHVDCCSRRAAAAAWMAARWSAEEAAESLAAAVAPGAEDEAEEEMGTEAAAKAAAAHASASRRGAAMAGLREEETGRRTNGALCVSENAFAFSFTKVGGCLTIVSHWSALSQRVESQLCERPC